MNYRRYRRKRVLWAIIGTVAFTGLLVAACILAFQDPEFPLSSPLNIWGVGR